MSEPQNKLTKEELKNKLKSKMEAKRAGRMNKQQKKNEMNKYFEELGIKPEEVDQLKAIGKQLEKLKNNVPYK